MTPDTFIARLCGPWSFGFGRCGGQAELGVFCLHGGDECKEIIRDAIVAASRARAAATTPM